MLRLNIIFSKLFFLSIGFLFCNFANAQGPNFNWAKNIGGASTDRGNSIAVDGMGNVYTTGNFDGTADFDPGVGVFNLSSIPPCIFISKLDAAGNFLWAKQMSGAAGVGYSIGIDSSGNVYTTGYFSGTGDFNPGVGIFNLTSAGYEDIFISKLDSSGNFIWAKQLGGVLTDASYSIALDKLGNVYTTGEFHDTADFDPGIGVFNLTAAGFNKEVFISKLDSSGNFVWAKKLGGSQLTNASSVIIDAIGDLYITGYFYGISDFDPGIAVYNMQCNLMLDIFICKLDTGGRFVWAKQFKGSGQDFGNYSATDALGNIYTTGVFKEATDFDPNGGVYDLISDGGGDIFIFKLDTGGNFIWAKKMGGLGDDWGNSITIDQFANVYTTGYFSGAVDFDPGVGIFNLNSSWRDIFISKLDSSGNFLWARQLGGPNAGSIGNSIAIDAMGNIYTTGYFNKTVDFDPGVGIFNLTTPGGNYDNVFVHKMNQIVGIDEIGNSSNSNIYPNPTRDLFSIELYTTSQIIIANTLGEVVLNKVFEEGKQNIDLKNQADGIYFVKICSEWQQQTTKLLKLSF